MTEQLFGRGALATVFKQRRRAVHRHLLTWQPHYLLCQSGGDVIETLTIKAFTGCPILDRASAYSDGNSTAGPTVHGGWRGTPVLATAKRLAIPAGKHADTNPSVASTRPALHEPRTSDSATS
jgi:hypothetical protein